jgi:hypothetical protein
VTLTKITENEDEWKPKVVNNYVPWNDRSTANKVGFIIAKFWKVIFNSIYFYFFPFLCIAFNFFAKKCSDIEQASAETDGTISTSSLCDQLESFYIRQIFLKPLFVH